MNHSHAAVPSCHTPPLLTSPTHKHATLIFVWFHLPPPQIPTKQITATSGLEVTQHQQAVENPWRQCHDATPLLHARTFRPTIALRNTACAMSDTSYTYHVFRRKKRV